jgi:acetylornithine deacetylase/succinyl-diaminopimelate desuccinylase-like protein
VSLERVDRYVDQYLEEAIFLLGRLVRQPSVAAQDLGVTEMAELCVRVLEEEGIPARLLELDGSPPLIVGDAQGASPRRLMLYSHYDVQPPDPTDAWQSPPFQLTRRNGKLYGRGASDNKGDLVARLFAVRALRAVRGDLPASVTFMLEGEEEVGSPHLAALLDQYADRFAADAGLLEARTRTPDGRPRVVLGVKGMLYVELLARAANRELHSSLAPVVPSAAWRLTWALASLKTPDGRVRVPGFYQAVRDWRADELDALAALPNDDAWLRDDLGLDGFLGSVSGLEYRKHLYGQPTCNICGIESGYAGPGAKTVLPEEARAKLDFRLVPDQEPRDILDKLRRHLDAEGFDDIEVRAAGPGVAPARASLSDPFVEFCAQTAKEHYGLSALLYPTDAATIGLSTLTQFLPYTILLAPGAPGYWGSNIHAPNEHIRIADLADSIKFHALLLARFAEAPALEPGAPTRTLASSDP